MGVLVVVRELDKAVLQHLIVVVGDTSCDFIIGHDILWKCVIGLARSEACALRMSDSESEQLRNVLANSEHIDRTF